MDPKKTRSVLRQQWRDVNDLPWTAEEEEGELSGVVLAAGEDDAELTGWHKDEWRYVSRGRVTSIVVLHYDPKSEIHVDSNLI
jgi:hypothetical protein